MEMKITSLASRVGQNWRFPPPDCVVEDSPAAKLRTGEQRQCRATWEGDNPAILDGSTGPTLSGDPVMVPLASEGGDHTPCGVASSLTLCTAQCVAGGTPRVRPPPLCPVSLQSSGNPFLALVYRIEKRNRLVDRRVWCTGAFDNCLVRACRCRCLETWSLAFVNERHVGEMRNSVIRIIFALYVVYYARRSATNDRPNPCVAVTLFQWNLG